MIRGYSETAEKTAKDFSNVLPSKSGQQNDKFPTILELTEGKGMSYGSFRVQHKSLFNSTHFLVDPDCP